jgi:glutathione synthase/RimK-type ligase-like ATP-grasp enzyme
MKIALITEDRFLLPQPGNAYVENIFLEDQILASALAESGFGSERVSWSDQEVDWSQFDKAIFRTTWDYFDRFEAFKTWLDHTENQVEMINSPQIIRWNWDKFYLEELEKKGIAIPPTLFIQAGSGKKLSDFLDLADWKEFILKPAVGGGGRHTYRFTRSESAGLEAIFQSLNQEEGFLLQAFQETILEKGEASLMVMDGKFTHAILKKARSGDFRVQDDFGGTVHPFQPNQEEIDFAMHSISTLKIKPLYGRVDIIWAENGKPLLSELELIEPELWFRNCPPSAKVLANALSQ